MDRIMGMMDRLGMEEGQVIEHPWVTRAIEVAQKRVETHNFEIRKQLLEYDNVMNKQREAVYSLRRDILENRSIKERVLEALDEAVASCVAEYLFAAQEEDSWDIEGLKVYLKAKFAYDVTPHAETLRGMNQSQAEGFLIDELRAVYEKKENDLGGDQLRQLERMVLLNVIDTKWKDHLYAMDQLKEGVGLRAYGQRDPLIEYKREGYEMFQMMYASINQEVVETLFRLRPARQPERLRGVFTSLPQHLVHDSFSSLEGQPAARPPTSGPEPQEPPSRPPAAQPVRHAGPKVGRNDPCPCGSGLKYKKCCGRQT